MHLTGGVTKVKSEIVGRLEKVGFTLVEEKVGFNWLRVSRKKIVEVCVSRQIVK
ncbi:hypothetical protein DSBG_3846 [Desulfosporosinus sp. BG]|nr:hypothetical protein DSBG_3846 [Desulfosporosinus sp. BG]